MDDEDFFADLESFRELVRKESGRRCMNPPVSAVENVPSGGYVRTLESMGRRICPEKPPCAKTVRKLIRQHGLPARKHGLGWLVRAHDLEEWMKKTFTGEGGS